MTKMQKRRIFYTALLFVFFTIALVSLVNINQIINDSKSTKYNLIYNNKSKVDYNLLITDNKFIKPEYVKSYETYISSLVKEIDMTMSYQYHGSSALPIERRSRVLATIYGLYNLNPTEQVNNPIMWKKEFVIKDYKVESKKELSDFLVEENFKLDFGQFNNEVINFKQNFALPTIAYLEVTLEVEFSGANEEYNLQEKQVVSAKIPLNEQVFSIDTLKENSEDKSVLSTQTNFIRKNQRKLTTYIGLTIAVIILIIITIKQILLSKDKQSFRDEVDSLKKTYDEIIVETKNMFKTKNLNLVKIVSFEEMLNLADSLVVPIMLFEDKNRAIFYILKSDMFYYYAIESKR